MSADSEKSLAGRIEIAGIARRETERGIGSLVLDEEIGPLGAAAYTQHRRAAAASCPQHLAGKRAVDHGAAGIPEAEHPRPLASAVGPGPQLVVVGGEIDRRAGSAA